MSVIFAGGRSMITDQGSVSVAGGKGLDAVGQITSCSILQSLDRSPAVEVGLNAPVLEWFCTVCASACVTSLE